MKFKKSSFFVPFFLLWFGLGLASAPAQLEKFLNTGIDEDAAKQSTPEQLKVELLGWQKEIETSQALLEKSDPADMDGISSDDVDRRRRLLEDAHLAITRHLSIIEMLKTAEDELTTAKEAGEKWRSFEESRPYSILMLDGLVDRREALAEKLTTQKSSLNIFRTSLDTLLAAAKNAEKETQSAEAAFAKLESEDKAARWKLETARLAQRALFVRASSLKGNISASEDLLAASKEQLKLLDRKIEMARKYTLFSEKDLQQVKQASEDRQADLQKHLKEARGEMVAASARREKTRKALEQTSALGDLEALEMAKLEYETAVTEVETLQKIAESLESYVLLESFVPEAYMLRRTALKSDEAAERQAATKSLLTLNERLEAWEIVAKNELDAVEANLARLEGSITVLPKDDPKLTLLNRQLEMLQENRDLIERAYASVTSQRHVLSRWVNGFQGETKIPWYQPLLNTVNRSTDYVKRVWNVPISSYEVVRKEGKAELTETRYVSLGTAFLAVVLFVIAYFVAIRLLIRVQNAMVERHLIGENQARTLRNWVSFVVGLLLALATLSWLSIPLTIFAFLAGALAIGVGFGTQTIIKNFISGIILLFERKVRVGDIVDVGGTLGVVSEINTRSSIVRGFDGIENLIPNSLFLENTVVNWTLSSRFLRKELTLGVAYGTPPNTVIDLMIETAERHGLILKDPAPFAIFENFGDNSLDFRMYYWIEMNDKTNGLVVGSDLRIMIEKRLTDLEIGVPYPQRDIHLDISKPLQVELKTPESDRNIPSQKLP
ncbi:mechanosensitive ion channel domain-containing protein [Luteolibacter sp. AS25]|uniref:mechanosensitive ion channel domain-containing protein n=1 Tax=Luteolibacter sp. AS25 TaxID=3135776 RepID=UPI00398B96DF